MKVDLTLAVNYLPACTCLCKALLLVTLVGLVPPGQEVHGGYISLAAMLYVDRALTRNIIFDANAILMSIYFANVHAAVRATSHQPAYWFLMWGLHLCWIGMCLTLIHEPASVKWFLERRVQAARAVPLLMMLGILAGTAHIHAPLEPPPLRACRAMSFTLLSFTWIYVVGIHSPNGIEYLKETSSQFIVRLAPVLYSPSWLAAGFTVAGVVALVLQYYHRFDGAHAELSSVQVAAHDEEAPKNYQPVRQTESQDDIRTQELFRQAKSLTMKGPHRAGQPLAAGNAGLEIIPE